MCLITYLAGKHLTTLAPVEVVNMETGELSSFEPGTTMRIQWNQPLFSRHLERIPVRGDSPVHLDRDGVRIVMTLACFREAFCMWDDGSL